MKKFAILLIIVCLCSCGTSKGLSDFSESKCPDSKNKKKHHKLMKQLAKNHKCKKGDHKCFENQDTDTTVIYPKFRTR